MSKKKKRSGKDKKIKTTLILEIIVFTTTIFNLINIVLEIISKLID